MIKLTPDQYRDFFLALTGAFDLFRLKMMLKFRLGKDLELETGGASGEEVFFNLIGKAERGNWIPELLAGAIAENDTPSLQQIATDLRPQTSATTVDHYNVAFVDNNLVLVNRSVLRKSLKQLASATPTGARILVVNGPPLSGKSYSVELISYLRRALKSFKFVWINLKDIAGEVRPEHIASAIVGQMNLAQNIIPDLNQEQDSRWIQLFCNRLQGVLGSASEPWWVVIDGFNHARLSPSVNDLIKELLGRIRLTLPELRMVLLSYPDNLAPNIEQVALREELSAINERDLIGFFNQIYQETNQTYSPRDIAERIGEVMRAADPRSPSYMEMLGVEVAKVAKRISA